MLKAGPGSHRNQYSLLLRGQILDRDSVEE